MKPNASHPYYSLPWLQRMAVHVPGYQDSLDRGDRRLADRSLRMAVVDRLRDMHKRLDEAIRQCERREASTQQHSLERVVAHLDRVLERIQASDHRIESAYEDGQVGPAKADFLQKAHLAVFEQAEAMVKHFEEPDLHHDRLPHVESDLFELERRLDEEARKYREIA